MHSLPPTTASATIIKSIALKHKLPTSQWQRQRATCAMASTTSIPTNKTTATSAAPRAQVDDDLLATVLRVHLETKLRRERLRHQTTNVKVKTRVLQCAVNALDEPVVGEQLTSHKSQFGFRDALVQLRHLQH